MKKIGIILLGLVAYSGVSFFEFKLDLTGFENSFDLVLTYLSIVIGFVLTTLGIMASSPFSRKLYLIPDEKDNSKNLLNRLMEYVLSVLLIFLIPIFLVFIYIVFPWKCFIDEVKTLSLQLILNSVIASFIVLIVFIRKMMSYIVQSAKSG